MFYPEQNLEPPEPPVVLRCEDCGADICVGDTYFDIAGDELCEDCASAWLERHRIVAEDDVHETDE